MHTLLLSFCQDVSAETGEFANKYLENNVLSLIWCGFYIFFINNLIWQNEISVQHFVDFKFFIKSFMPVKISQIKLLIFNKTSAPTDSRRVTDM